MSTPTNILELRRFTGMANQLWKFSSNLAQLTLPLRQLLSKKHTWLWGAAQEQAFARVMEELTTATLLSMNNPEAPAKISADASLHGLGAVLVQSSGQESTLKPVAHTMTETERHYAQIEKKALATIWACDKFAPYILGKKVHVKTDHKTFSTTTEYKAPGQHASKSLAILSTTGKA